MKISMSESKNTSIFFIATSSFGFLPVTAWQKRAPAPLVETSCKMWRSSAGQVQFCVSWKGSTSTKWTYCTNSERHFSTPPFLCFQNCGSVQWSERQSEKLKVWCGAWTRTKSPSVVNQGHCCLNFWVFGGKDHKTECKWEPVWTLDGGVDESEHTLPPWCDLRESKHTHTHTHRRRLGTNIEIHIIWNQLESTFLAPMITYHWPWCKMWTCANLFTSNNDKDFQLSTDKHKRRNKLSFLYLADCLLIPSFQWPARFSNLENSRELFWNFTFHSRSRVVFI